MSQIQVTPELIVGVFAFLLSVIFTYFPGLKVWFAKQSTERKSLIQIVGSLLIAGIVFFLGCQNWIVINITCTEGGAIELIKVVFVALTSNQVTYLATKNFQPKSVVEAKAARNAPVG